MTEQSAQWLLTAGVGSLLLIVWCMMLNKLSQLSGQVNLTIGTLASQLQQRFDLIPDTLRSAKEAVKAQREYFDRMLDVRRGMQQGVTPMDLGAMPPDLIPLAVASSSAAAGRSITESNPAMNVDGYTELQRIMKDTEKDVTAARRFYWAAVAEYNAAVRSFPLAIVAAVHRYRPLPDATITKELATKPDYFK